MEKNLLNTTYSCIITAFGESIVFETDSLLSLEFIAGLDHIFQLDDIEISNTVDHPLNQPYTIIYFDRDISHLVYDPERRSIILEERWSNIHENFMLRTLIFQLFSLKFQEQCKFILHASAVEYNNKAVLFTGNGGSGKTITALTLCKDFNYNLISNDKALVSLKTDSIYIEKGSKMFTLRRSSLNATNPDLSKRIFGNESDTDIWNSKKVLQPSDLEISISKGNIELSALVMLDVNQGWQGRPVFYRVPNDTHVHPWRDKVRLYQEISTVIRGTEFCPMTTDTLNSSLMMPLLDNPLTFANRTMFIETIVDKSNVFVLKGNLNHCIETINSLIGYPVLQQSGG
jgi:hypothetical protein